MFFPPHNLCINHHRNDTMAPDKFANRKQISTERQERLVFEVVRRLMYYRTLSLHHDTHKVRLTFTLNENRSYTNDALVHSDAWRLLDSYYTTHEVVLVARTASGNTSEVTDEEAITLFDDPLAWNVPTVWHHGSFVPSLASLIAAGWYPCTPSSALCGPCVHRVK